MKTFQRLIAGLGAALAAMIWVPASAQVLESPAPPASASGVQTRQAPPAPIGRALEERILVRGDVEEVSSRRTPPEAAGFMRSNDRHSEYTRAEWRQLAMRQGWKDSRGNPIDPDASFDQRRKQNYGMCVRTTYHIFRWADMTERYQALLPGGKEIAQRYVGLRDNIIAGSKVRSGGNVLQAIIGTAAFGPAYGGMAAAGAAGSEAQGQAYDKSALLNRDAGLLNSGLTLMHIEAAILSAEAYQEYFGLVEDYCTEFLGEIPAQQ